MTTLDIDFYDDMAKRHHALADIKGWRKKYRNSWRAIANACYNMVLILEKEELSRK